MKVQPKKTGKTDRDYMKEHHEDKGRKWCEKCQVWFDIRFAQRHQH